MSIAPRTPFDAIMIPNYFNASIPLIASMEKLANRRPRPFQKVEWKKIQSKRIMDAPTPVESRNSAKREKEYMASSDKLLRHNIDDSGAASGTKYDIDEYDQSSLNDNTIATREDIQYRNALHNKRLQTQPPYAKLGHTISEENKQLFREAERQSETARMATIGAFRMKHAHPAGANVGTTALDVNGAAEYGSRSWPDEGKPHVAGLQEDCIRPEGEFFVDGVDSNVDVGGGQNQPKTHSHLLGDDYEHQLKSFISRKHKKTHEVGVTQEGASNGPDVLFPESGLYGHRQGDISISNEGNAFPFGEKGTIRSWHHHQQRGGPSDRIEDSTKTKLSSSTEDLNAHKIDASSDDGDDNNDDDDYDSEDASVRDSPVIESKSNIAKIDEIGTVAGAMGDDFHWNTLNYLQGEYSNSMHDDRKNPKFKQILTPPIQKSPKILSSNNRDFIHGVVWNGRRKLRPQDATDPSKNVYYDQRSSYDNSARRTFSKKTHENDDDKNQTSNNAKRDESQTNEKFFDKSTRARMKIRSSDGAVDDTGDGREEGAGSGGVVETSGKDGVVPAFPLNGYPGYLKVRTFNEYTKPAPTASIYNILENEPPEYLPHQPPFAKELGDPNLTVNDKIHLIDALTPHHEVNDGISQKFDNKLDSSFVVHDPNNYDRMPVPAIISSLNKSRKNLKKRSYVMYDDLTMHDTYDEYDDLSHESPLSGDKPNEGAICRSCNGQKCPANGKSCVCNREDSHCKCILKEEKKIRSVSDAWYSVFNMSAPLQFLTTRVGIYRKRHAAWWRIAPSITLTSLSGIYANGNLSILFSSHVDIFQLKHPLTLKNQKLLIPQYGEDVNRVQPSAFKSVDPNEILAIDTTKFDFSAIHDETKIPSGSKEDERNPTSAKKRLCGAAISAAERRRKRHSHSTSDEVLSIGDLGYFPGSMNILEQCPSDSKHLCLNMLDEEVPVKIKQPFQENVLIYNGEYKVRIASVISDATTKGALQVAVVLVNEDCVVHEFAICICNCPMTCGAKTIVKKDLAPHVSETITFLLPLEETKDTKRHCNVEVKSPDQKVISKRKFIVEPTARCLCIWDCNCHCIHDLISHDEYNVCHKLDGYEEHAAGFIDGDGRGELDQELKGWQWFWWRISHHAISLLLCMLFLGFLKAILGAVALRRIDRCGYDYVQPLQKYDYASRCRRFFINIVFFVVLPFIFCCQCFIPTEEDLLIASTEWQCSLVQHEISEDSSGNGDGGRTDGGGWKPFQRFCSGNEGGNNANIDDDGDEETILSQCFESGMGSKDAGVEVSQSKLSEYLTNDYNYSEDEEERDTNYVLQALTESREYINQLLNSHCSDDLDPHNPLTKDAEQLVRKLVVAKIVYRTFDVALENVDVPIGQRYSIRGYFVPSIGPGYQYFTPTPLVQHRRITSNGSDVLLPPVILRNEEFSRAYINKLDVLDAGDLSVDPPKDAPCINSSNTANESQSTTVPTLPEFGFAWPSTPPPVGGSGSTANNVVTEPEAGPANDIAAARSQHIVAANIGSNLMTKQKDSPKGSE